MNICVFTGYINDNLEVLEENDVAVIEFTLVTYEYRKSKATGETTRIPTYLRCEAWHTGAETIAKLGSRGSKVTVHCTARNMDDHSDEIIFRINKFDFADE